MLLYSCNLQLYVGTINSQSDDNEMHNLYCRNVIVSKLEDNVIKLQHAVIIMFPT